MTKTTTGQQAKGDKNFDQMQQGGTDAKQADGIPRADADLGGGKSQSKK